MHAVSSVNVVVLNEPARNARNQRQANTQHTFSLKRRSSFIKIFISHKSATNSSQECGMPTKKTKDEENNALN